MIRIIKKSTYLIGVIFGIAGWFILFLLILGGFNFWEDTHIDGVPLEETTCWTSVNCD